MILDPSHPLAELLRRDQRYRFEAYVFVFDALRYAQEKLGLGRSSATDDGQEDEDLDDETDFDEADLQAQQHVSGQQLCEAIRQYALEQYGLLARQVLGHWGIRKTSDFGEIVFNLIDIGQMRKTDDDRREDFDSVFDFGPGFQDDRVFVGLLSAGKE
jgi:uncharacterized repeat protein (TIGR04138 family)